MIEKSMPDFIMQRVRKQIEDIFGEEKNQGAGITIAVLDSGVSRHPDLVGKIAGFRDFSKSRNQSGADSPFDDNGHGTHVCGIICGSGLASGGRYRGIAPGARLIVGKVLDDKGEGEAESLLEAMDWILSVREKYAIRILNLSVGIGELRDSRREELLAEKTGEVCRAGILVVCAAGNKGPAENSISAVGKSGDILTVGCHDGRFYGNDKNRCALYSGRGAAGGKGRKPDLVAPGTDVLSCNREWYYKNGRLQDAYIPKSGTSMAAPIVAGAAALALQKYPLMTNETCQQKMKYTATNLGIPWNQQGWGMINIRRLLTD